MAKVVATLIFTVLLSTALCQVNCFALEDKLIVNTPAKFADLKAGVFDGKYRHVEITNRATADVLLQPQHFVNAPFESLTFKTIDYWGVMNRIEMFPGQPAANVSVHFFNGAHPLDGAPKHFPLYELFISEPAVLSDANTVSILQWKSARHIRIYDNACTAAVSLMRRLGQLSQLKQLQGLTVSLSERASKQIEVAVFIANLESLTSLTFSPYTMSVEQITAFIAKNPVPANWRVKVVDNDICFTKH